ncbi:MAG: hypothetical protein BGO78_03425 [Chloroflexi bacterium 44-23]|nr:MAG: hypothetical protein BGO78_03425 [Chloroflexi bacterium 44-23]
MKFLIAGFGSIGRRHFRNLLTLGQKDILFLRSFKSTLETDELDGFVVETELDKALAHRPDAVIITNPTALHLDIAIPAARQGCNLFFEKPISDSLEHIDQLKATLESGGGQAMTGFQFRFHPGLQKIKELISGKVVGNLVACCAHWGEFLPAWHPWEDYRQSYSAKKDLGGGVVLTLSHPLDYVHWLLGDAESLWSFIAQVPTLEIETEAVAEIGIRFTQGVVASIHLNYIQHPPVHKLELIGDQGTIRWDNASGSVELYQRETNLWQSYPTPAGFDRNDMFLAEMQHFIDCVQKQKTPVCTLEDGIYTQKLVNAVYQSAIEERIIKFHGN